MVQHAAEKQIRLRNVRRQGDGFQKLIESFGKAAHAIGADTGCKLNLGATGEDFSGTGNGCGGLGEIFVLEVELNEKKMGILIVGRELDGCR